MIKQRFFNPLIFLFTLSSFIALNSCDTSKKKENKEPEIEVQETKSATAESNELIPEYIASGKSVYTQNCLVCHQSTGTGVPGLNPPLKKTPYVLEDKERLIGIILNGSNDGLVVNGSTYSNAMPAFAMLSDLDVANVTSYIRNSFGNKAEPITENEVKEYRATLK